MFKWLTLGLELVGYMMIAIFLGDYLDRQFSLNWGKLVLVAGFYILWFYQLYKNFR